MSPWCEACEQRELKNEKSIRGPVIPQNSDDAGSLNCRSGFNDVKEKGEKSEIAIIM